MEKKNLVFIFVIAFITLFVISCADTPTDDVIKTTIPELTLQDELALLLDGESTDFIISPETLHTYVQDFLEARSSKEDKYSQLEIIGMETFTKIYSPGFKYNGEIPEISEINFHVFILRNPDGNEGFALTCEDIRVGNVIAVVKSGNFFESDHFLDYYKSVLIDYCGTVIETFNRLTEEDIRDAKDKVAQIKASQNNARLTWFTDIWEELDETWYWSNHSSPHSAPLIKTEWGQVNKYAMAITSVNPAGLNPSRHYKAGPDTVALAQLVAYHRWTYSYRTSYFIDPVVQSYRTGNVYNPVSSFTHFYTGTSYPFNPSNNTSLDYNWNRMLSASTIDGIYGLDLPDVEAQIATLIFQMGARMGKEFTEYGDIIQPVQYVWNTLYEMGYSYYGIVNNSNASEVFPAYFGFKRSIDESKPIYATAMKMDSPGSFIWTAWLIDDYFVLGFRDRIYPGVTKVFLHCNTGNGNYGNNNGWYNLGPLNSNNLYYDREGAYKKHPQDWSGTYNNDVNYLTGIWVPENIRN